MAYFETSYRLIPILLICDSKISRSQDYSDILVPNSKWHSHYEDVIIANCLIRVFRRLFRLLKVTFTDLQDWMTVFSTTSMVHSFSKYSVANVVWRRCRDFSHILPHVSNNLHWTYDSSMTRLRSICNWITLF